VIDPSLIDFLLGIGIGFIEDESVVCPHCNFDFMPEEIITEDEEYVCPCCFERLADGQEE
jgi:DNA-directed RNA polymerase subunit RPC12/RpoP